MKQPAFPHLARPSDGYVFVVTYGLSGDVGLQDLINRLDGVCLRGENGGVINYIADAWTATAEAAGHDGAAFAHLNQLGWHLADAFAGSVLALPDGIRFGGFREIRWSEDPAEFERRLDFLYSFFPNARFVFHSRTPEDVAGLGWWAEQPSDEVVASLSRRCALFDAYLVEYPNRGIRLDYDEYIAAPDELAPLFELFGQPFSRSVVDRWIKDQRA